GFFNPLFLNRAKRTPSFEPMLKWSENAKCSDTFGTYCMYKHMGCYNNNNP
ncbi:Uncharacterized protein APZ42_002733, partial [Daphnia magna]